ncbi:MAG: OadG family protein [Clostridium sp.]|nr:OadG family protein [Clostridium sp.]
MEGLSMTFVGVTVVFASLALLCVIIYLFPLFTPKKNKTSSNEVLPEQKDNEPEKNVSSDDSLVAVLTAAVLASMKKRPDVEIRVTSFKRIQQTSPIWNGVGREEYIFDKLS